MAQYPPTEMFARIDVEVDTPSHLPLISSIDLKAVVGVAKLHLSRQIEVIIPLLTLRIDLKVSKLSYLTLYSCILCLCEVSSIFYNF